MNKMRSKKSSEQRKEEDQECYGLIILQLELAELPLESPLKTQVTLHSCALIVHIHMQNSF